MDTSSHSKKRGVPTGKERIDELVKLRYLLLVENMSQREAARILGRSTRTICVWVKEIGLRNEVSRSKKREKQTARGLKLNNNLPAFESWLRIHHKSVHDKIQPFIKEFTQYS